MIWPGTGQTSHELGRPIEAARWVHKQQWRGEGDFTTAILRIEPDRSADFDRILARAIRQSLAALNLLLSMIAQLAPYDQA